MSDNDATDLTGKLLLAMPGMTDPRFFRSVIYICAHDKNGAMGLVINAPHHAIEFDSILEQLEIASEIEIDNMPEDIEIMEGGPVETVRGFLLHSSEFYQKDTVRIDDDFSVTGTVDVLKRVAKGEGPKEKLFMLGHAGWSGGQLEDELARNSWLVAEPTPELVFNTPHDEKWEKAMLYAGINPAMLSAASGRA